jgi:hypothetical protein
MKKWMILGIVLCAGCATTPPQKPAQQLSQGGIASVARKCTVATFKDGDKQSVNVKIQ